MIDFYEREDFDRTVYLVEDGKIIEERLRDLVSHYAEETTTPKGVGKRFHIRDNELWDWGPQGNASRYIDSFSSLKAAEHALLLCHRHDLLNGDDNPQYFDTRDEAEIYLKEGLSNEY